MTDYTHTDTDGDILTVEKGPRGTLVRAQEKFQDKMHMAAVYYAEEDASALALAILETAGVKPSLTAALDCAEHYERRALAHLETARKLRAKRGAEDAKIRDWLRIIAPSRFIRDTYTPSELERQTYHEARRFFEGQ